MPISAYTIAADQASPSQGDGFIRAETIRDAVRLHGHRDVNVYPMPADFDWRGPDDCDVWSRDS